MCFIITCEWNVQLEQIHRDRKQIVGYGACGMGSGEWLLMGLGGGSFWGDENVLAFVVMVMWSYEYTKNYLILYFKEILWSTNYISIKCFFWYFPL